MADFLHEPVPDEVKPGAPVAPVRAVEIVVDGSERKTIGGSVVTATLPPIATAEVSPRAGTEATVTVCENVILPAGGLVEMQYGVAVPLEVVDEATTYEGPVVAQGCTQAFTPRLARDDPVLPVDSQRRRVKQRQATEATVDALCSSMAASIYVDEPPRRASSASIELAVASFAADRGAARPVTGCA